eukprot:g3077.t1
MSSFSGDYVIPADPVHRGALLYYFIGMTNYPVLFANETAGVHNIIQPVLSWGRGDDGNKNGTWSISQWFCCPRGVVAHSPYIWGFEEGDVISTSMRLAENNTMVLNASWTDPATSSPAKSSLALTVNRTYDYNHSYSNNSEVTWINTDVTLEVYGMRNCSGYPPKGMVMKRLLIQDNSSARRPIVPDWVMTLPSDHCDGELIFSSTEPFSSPPTASPQEALFITRTDPDPPFLPTGGLVESFKGRGAYTTNGTIRLRGLDLPGWDINRFAGASWHSDDDGGLLISSPTPQVGHYKIGDLSRRLPAQRGPTTLQVSLRGGDGAFGANTSIRILEMETSSWWFPTRFLELNCSATNLTVAVSIPKGLGNRPPPPTHVILWTVEVKDLTSLTWSVSLTEQGPGLDQWQIAYRMNGEEQTHAVDLAATKRLDALQNFTSGVYQECQRTFRLLLPRNESAVVDHFSLMPATTQDPL